MSDICPILDFASLIWNLGLMWIVKLLETVWCQWTRLRISPIYLLKTDSLFALSWRRANWGVAWSSFVSMTLHEGKLLKNGLILYCIPNTSWWEAVEVWFHPPLYIFFFFFLWCVTHQTIWSFCTCPIMLLPDRCKNFFSFLVSCKQFFSCHIQT